VRAEGEALILNPVVLELTVSATVVLAVVLPLVPVIVTVEVPAVAELLAVSVRTLEVVEEVGLNEAVTPLGRPLAVNATVPLKPFTGVTVTVSVVLLPWVTAREDAEPPSVKLGVPVVDPDPTNVVMLCPGSEYVNALFDTLTALSCAIWLEAEVW